MEGLEQQQQPQKRGYGSKVDFPVAYPFYDDKRDMIRMFGSVMPVHHLAQITRTTQDRILSICKQQDIKLEPGADKLGYRALLDIEHLPRILPELGWTPELVAEGVTYLRSYVRSSDRTRVTHKRPHNDDNDDDEDEDVSVKVLPRKQRSPAPAPTSSLESLAERIEKSVAQCVAMVGQQAVAAYCSSALFQQDRNRRLEDEMKALVPLLREELKPRVLALMVQEKREAIAKGMDHDLEVAAVIGALQERGPAAVPTFPPLTGSQDSTTTTKAQVEAVRRFIEQHYSPQTGQDQ